MNNLQISISNSLNVTSNSDIFNFYTSDKFIYLIFNKLPSCNLACKLTNRIVNRFIEIPIEISTLKRGIDLFNIPYCTVPVMSLYGTGLINEWDMVIYDDSLNRRFAEFTVYIKIAKNLSTGKPYLSKESFCGIFFEHKA